MALYSEEGEGVASFSLKFVLRNSHPRVILQYTWPHRRLRLLRVFLISKEERQVIVSIPTPRTIMLHLSWFRSVNLSDLHVLELQSGRREEKKTSTSMNVCLFKRKKKASQLSDLRHLKFMIRLFVDFSQANKSISCWQSKQPFWYLVIGWIQRVNDTFQCFPVKKKKNLCRRCFLLLFLS